MATNIDFLHLAWDLERSCLRQWEIHFLGMQPSYSGWILLEKFCKERFGIDDKSADFQDMLRGFDNEIYKVDRELWVLAKAAVDMGLADVFKTKSAEEIIPAMEQPGIGKAWLTKFTRIHAGEGMESD